MIKAKFGPGTYFIGDICYALDEQEYNEIWGTQNKYEDGSYNGFAVAGTAYGDGVYEGSDGVDYGVDAGVLGVVEKSHWDAKYDDNTLNRLGKIIEVKNELTFEAEDGDFLYEYDGQTLEIPTRAYDEYDEDNNYYEEDDDYYEDEEVYENLNKKLKKSSYINIKQLNETLDKILNEEKRNLIPDLIAKYGDLTIPEFIDELIEKEKNREEILDESLSENSELLTSKYSKFKKVPGGNLGTFEGEILGQPVRYGIDIYMGLNGDVPYYWKKLENAGYKEQIRLGTKGNMADKLFYIPKPVISKVCHPCYFIYNIESNTWKQKCPCGWLNEYIEYWTSLKFNSEEITEKEAKVWLSDYIKESPLEKLRKKTIQNTKTKSTTVKQALSKSAVIKKIQALQNPTPEQLAKILAAIE